MDAKSVASKGKNFGFLNLQDFMQANNQQVPNAFQGYMVSSSNPQAHEAFAVTNASVRKPEMPVSFLDCHVKTDITKSFCDEDSCYEHVDGKNEIEKEKNGSSPCWHRVRWTDQMVKLLITAVSYIGEEAGSDCGGGRSGISPSLPRKGKWKAISKVMAERGFLVSPQQCEDKFNDLNKRYKKLNDILGRGTCCDVVENPALLDLIDITDKSKERVRKILGSKQLFYQEMCSYHNGNRLYIPHDQAVQKSLHSALRNADDLECREEKENNVIDCPNDEFEEKRAFDEDLGSSKVPSKRKKSEEHEHMNSDRILNFPISTKKSVLHHDHAKIGNNEELQGNYLFVSRSRQLEEQKLRIEAEKLELEKQRLKWLKFNEIEDRELEKMKMENKYLMLENERLGLEIKRREMSGHAKCKH